jgi:hypothetical protein
LKAANDKAAADLTAANTAAATAAKTASDAATAAATKAAADLKAATDKAAADQVAAVAAQKATDDAAAAAAAAKAAADLKAANDTITALQNPAGTSKSLTTSTDVLIGTAGNDTFSGATSTLSTSDIVVDATTTDNDTLTISATASVSAFVVANVENINIALATTNGTNPSVDAGSFTGVKNLTITGTDVVVGGSAIAGDKDVVVTNVNSSKITKVTAGVDANDVSVTQATKAGVVVDASTATGNIAVTGAATVNANLTTGTVTMTRLNSTVEDAKAVVVNAALASSVTTADSSFTGTVEFNAAKASTITILNAAGGAIVNGGTTSTADTTIRVDGIDNSGATITTGLGYLAAASKNIAVNLDGTTDATDVATVAAAGYISLDANTTDLVETVNLSGTTAAVTYAMVTSAPTTYNLTGSQSVTVSNTAAAFTTNTLTDNTTGGTTTASVTSVGTADLSKIAADVIEIADAGTSAVLTVKSGANLSLASDQTTAFSLAGKTAEAAITLSTADDTAADGTTINLTVGAFTADTNVKTLNLNATVGKFTATSTTLDYAGSDATVLTISGTKAVTLGNTAAVTVNATGLTGALSLTALDGIDTDGGGADDTNDITAASITSGSASDSITVNDTGSDYTVFTVDAGNGNNTITITGAKVGSSFTTGIGTDTVNINAAAAYVVVTGDGNDTVKIGHNVDSDAIIVAGAGSSDTLIFLDTDGNDFANNVNFGFSGFEVLDISALTSGAITIDNIQFGGKTLEVVGTASGSDQLIIKDDGTGAGTIDASNVTLTDALLELQGGAGNDTITGSEYDDVLNGGVGSDILNGGSGTDTATYTGAADTTDTGTQTGIVVNLGSTAITNTTILGTLGTSNGYTASSITSVAANTAVYVYGDTTSTNSAATDTLSSIENVIGTAGNDYIVGSVAANTITGGAGADYLKGGLGADIFVFATGDSGITASTADTIADFTTASDQIKVGVTGAAGTVTIANGAAMVDLDAVITAADAVFDGTKKVYVAYNVNGGGDAYVIIDHDGNDTDTGDTVIKLVGINLVGEIAVTDFIS